MLLTDPILPTLGFEPAVFQSQEVSRLAEPHITRMHDDMDDTYDKKKMDKISESAAASVNCAQKNSGRGPLWIWLDTVCKTGALQR